MSRLARDVAAPVGPTPRQALGVIVEVARETSTPTPSPERLAARVPAAFALATFLAVGCAHSRQAAIEDSVARASVKDVSADVARAEGERKAMEAQAAACREAAIAPVSLEDERARGDALAAAFVASTGAVYLETSPVFARPEAKDPAAWAGLDVTPGSGPRTQLTAWLDRLGKGLAARSTRPGLDWTFFVVESPKPLAFSAPGGLVAVTTGLLAQAENEAQVAFVLAHEVAHVAGRDGLVTWQRTQEAACRARLVSQQLSRGLQTQRVRDPALRGLAQPNAAETEALTGQLAERVAASIVQQGFGGELEVAADQVATELLVLSGYDARAAAKGLDVLAAGGHLSPAPDVAARHATVEKTLAEALAGLPVDLGRAPPKPREADALPK